MRSQPLSSALAGSAIILAGLASGCGLGPGPSTDGTATLTVTRDFGREPVLETTVADPPASLTVLRMLDQAAAIETRYGGGFVQSIEGSSGGVEDGRNHDWFFYVNGVESTLGAAEAEAGPGDRVWWDERDWTSAMRIPAVVGSWPEPLLGAGESAAAEATVVFDCRTDAERCATAAGRLDETGIEHRDPGDQGAGDVPRVLVGEWSQVNDDPAAELLRAEPSSSGVFARFGDHGLELLDSVGKPEPDSSDATGLVAAVRLGDEAPVWLVIGIDQAGLDQAIAALDQVQLRDRYAVAATDAGVVALPLPVNPGQS